MMGMYIHVTHTLPSFFNNLAFHPYTVLYHKNLVPQRFDLVKNLQTFADRMCIIHAHFKIVTKLWTRSTRRLHRSTSY